MIKVFLEGEWVEGIPSEGQHFRVYDEKGGFNLLQEPFDRKRIVITSHNKRHILQVGEEMIVTVEIQNQKGERLPLTDSFSVPIGRIGKGNYTTLLLSFENGIATRSYTWVDAGEFEITKEMINTHLPSEQQLEFNGFNISVVE